MWPGRTPVMSRRVLRGGGRHHGRPPATSSRTRRLTLRARRRCAASRFRSGTRRRRLRGRMRHTSGVTISRASPSTPANAAPGRLTTREGRTCAHVDPAREPKSMQSSHRLPGPASSHRRCDLRSDRTPRPGFHPRPDRHSPVRRVLHNRCDVRPDHLTVGTPAQNVADTVRRGRWTSHARTGARQWRELFYGLRRAARLGDNERIAELLRRPVQLALWPGLIDHPAAGSALACSASRPPSAGAAGGGSASWSVGLVEPGSRPARGNRLVTFVPTSAARSLRRR